MALKVVSKDRDEFRHSEIMAKLAWNESKLNGLSILARATLVVTVLCATVVLALIVTVHS